MRDARLIRTPFYVETLEWDTTVYEQFLKGQKIRALLRPVSVAQRFSHARTGVAAVSQVNVRMRMSCWLVGTWKPVWRRRWPGLRERSAIVPPRDADPHGEPAAQSVVSVNRWTHLVVLPSLIDNLPNACLEAMGLGKVVIGTTGRF